MTSKVDLLVLGATGVTGRQATRYLHAHPERSSFTLAIAARSQNKLDALIKEYSLPSSIQVFVLDVTNFAQVEEVVKKAKVVLNTVGPYYRWGTPVVRACARNGVHYVDLTGEPYWIKEIINQYDYCASKTGSIIVPGCGLDSIPSDISVFLANKAIKESSPNKDSPLQIAESTTSWKVNGIVSYGSFHTVMTLLEIVPKKLRKEWRADYYLSPVTGRPTPRPRFTYSLFIPSALQTHVGGFFIMHDANKAIVERSWGLFEHKALSSSSSDPNSKIEAEQARYGPRMVYDEFMRTSGTVTAGLVSLTLLVGFMLMKIKPIRWFLKMVGPQEGTVHKDATLEKGSFSTVNVSKAESSNTQVVVTLKGKGDPGYLLSPILMADCALTLLSAPSSLSPLARAYNGGVLTPATAFGDAFVERVKANPRFTVDVEVVKDGQGRGKEGKKDI